MTIAPARRVAYRVLLLIATTDAHSDDLLRSREVDALSPPDRNLTTTLVLGTLRWQLALEARIQPLLARPNAQLSPEVATALRMAAYQLLYLDRIPPHAAINDAVELVKQSPQRHAAGMVNAVLRKLASQPKPVIPQQPTSVPAIAAVWAHPEWMVERWARQFGLEAVAAICRWNQEPAGVTIRLAASTAEPEGIETEQGFFLSKARRLLRGDLGAPVRASQIRIQDEASQLVAEIASAVSPSRHPRSAQHGPVRVLDLCAAPGGKTAILSERLLDAEITAVDVSRKRLELARALLVPLSGDRIRYQVADAASLRLEPEYQLILCDVPCSGTGTLARNPEIRHRIDEVDLARQQARQVAILKAGLAGLAPGGRLIYSTCSLEPEENQAVVEKVLRDTPGSVPVSVAGILDQLAHEGTVTEAGRERLQSAVQGVFLRTIPGIHPCDGFFAAVLERA
jgi:16S rRNA (cytosine967-C5)-methyltransferase